MKILAISDIYEDIDLINDLKRKFYNEKIDAIVIAGGIGYYHEQRKDQYFKNITEIFGILSSIAKKIIYVPGGTDIENLKINHPTAINVDKNAYLFQDNEIKTGFLGLGGIPQHSVRYQKEFSYRWIEKIFFDDFLRKLRVEYEKLEIEKPEYFIFITHSPPYGILDYSQKITLNLIEVIEEIEDEERKKKTSTNPLHIGSRIIKEFLNKKMVDMHIFGHVHKMGGSVIEDNNTLFFNVSHLSIDPYRLSGRKYLLIELSKNSHNHMFGSLVDSTLSFEEFLRKYL